MRFRHAILPFDVASDNIGGIIDRLSVRVAGTRVPVAAVAFIYCRGNEEAWRFITGIVRRGTRVARPGRRR